jgi:hypothetical protein
VSTLAGTCEEGHRDGEGTVAQFKSHFNVAVDGDGNVFVTDRGRGGSSSVGQFGQEVGGHAYPHRCYKFKIAIG